MFEHKDGCPFKGFHKYEETRHQDGPDISLEICETGIEYTDDHSYMDIKIEFNFCPCCGVPKT